MAWICASGMDTLLRKPSRAPLIVLSGELQRQHTASSVTVGTRS